MERRQMDTVERFTDRAADYVRYRPTYPAEAVDTILDGLGPPEHLVAAVLAQERASRRGCSATGVSG